MRKFLTLPLVLLLTACTQTPKPTALDHRIARIEQHLIAPSFATPVPADRASIRDRLEYYHVPGVSVAVIHAGKVEWAKGYGTADLSTGAPVNQYTLFHGASLSKMANAVTVLRFAQDGKLDIDKDVNAQLSSWHLPPSEFTKGKPITLRQCLSHTAGMSVRFLGIGFSTTQPTESLVDFLNGKPPATQPVRVVDPPGKQYYYSAGAVAISQLMLEEVAKKPYPQIVRETVFNPLAMRETTFELKLPDGWLPRAAPGYKDGKRVNGPDRVYPAMSAAGIWTTPEDFAKLVIEIQSAANGHGKVLSQGAAYQMLRPYIENAKSANARSSKVGLGCFLAGKGDSAHFYHAGSHAGYACYAMGFLNHDDGIVVMTNGDDAFDLINEIVQTVAKDYGWTDYEVMPPPRAKDRPTTKSTTKP